MEAFQLGSALLAIHCNESLFGVTFNLRGKNRATLSSSIKLYSTPTAALPFVFIIIIINSRWKGNFCIIKIVPALFKCAPKGPIQRVSIQK